MGARITAVLQRAVARVRRRQRPLLGVRQIEVVDRHGNRRDTALREHVDQQRRQRALAAPLRPVDADDSRGSTCGPSQTPPSDGQIELAVAHVPSVHLDMLSGEQ